MTISDRLDGLIRLMQDASGEYEHVAATTRRALAIGIITVESSVIEQLEATARNWTRRLATTMRGLTLPRGRIMRSSNGL